MGTVGYLMLRKELAGGSEPSNETILYETKVFVPFAWSILFAEQDVHLIRGELVLATQRDRATTLARKRMAALTSVITAGLAALLDQFVTSIESAHDGWLVLDPYRIETDEEELVAPIRWFETPDAGEVEHVFGDDDGVELDDNDRVGVGDIERVAGWTIDGTDPPWFAQPADDDDDD